MGGTMWSRNLIPVWIGIIALSSMFLLGQETWPPSTPPAIGTPNINPGVIYSGVPTKIVISVHIPIDPKFIPLSVTVLRVDQTGTTLGEIGTLYDDGTNGDPLVSDNTFTSNQITFNEPNPTTIYFRMSVAYQHVFFPAVSAISSIDVLSMPPLEQLFFGVKAELVSGDIEGALTYFTETRKEEYRQIFLNFGPSLPQYTSTFGDLHLEFAVHSYARFTYSATREDGSLWQEIADFVKDPDGVWRIRDL